MKSLDRMTESELKRVMNSTADAVKHSLPTGSLFVVLVSGKSGIAQYVSNAVRSDIIKFLRETANRLENREDNPR